MKNFFKPAQKATHKIINGKVVLVMEWPVKENKDQSWGRCGYDSLYK